MIPPVGNPIRRVSRAPWETPLHGAACGDAPTGGAAMHDDGKQTGSKPTGLPMRQEPDRLLGQHAYVASKCSNAAPQRDEPDSRSEYNRSDAIKPQLRSPCRPLAVRLPQANVPTRMHPPVGRRHPGAAGLAVAGVAVAQSPRPPTTPEDPSRKPSKIGPRPPATRTPRTRRTVSQAAADRKHFPLF